jgi:hypothetical protein
VKDYDNNEVEFDQRHGKGICTGDSGGPGYILDGKRLMIWGVTSEAWPDNEMTDLCSGDARATRLYGESYWIKNSINRLRNADRGRR